MLWLPEGDRMILWVLLGFTLGPWVLIAILVMFFLGWYDIGVSESSAAVCNIRQDDPHP